MKSTLNTILRNNTGIPSILAYCLSSITMTIVNKSLLSNFPHEIAFLMLSFQALVCVLLIRLFGYLKLLNFKKFNSKDAKIWLLVSIAMASMLYTGSKSLQYLKVSLFTVFKNLTIVAIAYSEYLIFKTKLTKQILLSFLLVITSSVVGAMNDFSLEFRGVFWMFLNCLSSAVFVIYMRYSIKKVSFKDFDTVYYNNLLTLPMFIVFSLLVDDWSGMKQYYIDKENTSGELLNLISALIFGGFSAFGISYSSAWCIRATSSTTYSMVGALNKLPIAIFGIIYFHDSVSFGGAMAIILAFIAGLLYSYAKATTNSKMNGYKKGIQDNVEEQEDELPKPVSLQYLNKRET